MHPLRFIHHLARRLCRWAYEPTSEEKLRTAFQLGKVAERNEQLSLPIARAQNTGPIVQLPEKLCWPTKEWSRRYYEKNPHLYTSATPLRSRLTVRLEPLSESHTDPFQATVEETAPYETLPKFLR
jgi:hypothetical protein